MIPEGLKNSLNRIREISTEVYHQYIPIIDENTNISQIGEPILNYQPVANEFLSHLINRIVYTQFEIKYFKNPLQDLEGDEIPIGYTGQEIYVNPAKGRQYNVNDFAGLLQKYEADVKVQYLNVNSDFQYPVTISRHKLKQAFTSWENLNSFIDGITQSLYNGAYMDEFRFTKGLVSSAYLNNSVIIANVQAPTTEEIAKEFVTQARLYYLNFQTPSPNYNAWAKIGGYGRPIITMTPSEDIIFLLRNDIRSFLDVNVLANAFNIDKTTILGKIYPIDNFDVYDDDGNKIFDGSNIVGFIGDKRWFRIKRQDMYMDEFYNANNRTWQYYLNLTKMYHYSYFANGVIFATEEPKVTITGLDYNNTTTHTLEVNETKGFEINVTPSQANTPSITYETSNAEVASIETDDSNDRIVKVTGVAEGIATITATSGNVSASIEITITPKE